MACSAMGWLSQVTSGENTGLVGKRVIMPVQLKKTQSGTPRARDTGILQLSRAHYQNTPT